MQYLIVFLLSLTISLISIPFVKKFGEKFNLVDRKDSRKIDKELKVRIGGIGIFIGFFVSLLIFHFGNINKLELLYPDNLKPILLGAFFIFMLGVIDDIRSISPWPRLFAEVLISIYIWSVGVRIDSFSIKFFPQITDIEFPIIISLLLTVIWITGFINAFNWFDGLDGLASGMACIYLFFIFIFAYINTNYLVCITSSALLGSNLGFLKFNKKPAELIMGDGGSYLNGFLLSVLGLISIEKISSEQNIIAILMLFLVPLLDMSYVIYTRIKLRKSPFFPDRNHLHQRLLNKGYSEDFTLKYIYFLALLSGLFSLIILNRL